MPNALVPVFKGWNVWTVYQKKDLDIEPSMIGLDRDRRLRIWVENLILDYAGGADVADPVALRGSMVEIVPGAPSGLSVAASRARVPGELLTLDGPAELRTVRFFNRGSASNLAWPKSDNYLLENVYKPETDNPLTSAAAPGTTASSLGQGLQNTFWDSLGPVVVIGAAAFAVYLFVKTTK